jgi:ATP-dependent exoDNAse (exonuclease V) alpha subunit
MNALRERQTKFIFIQGIAGSGKSTLIKKIMASARSEDFLSLGCASTGLAATVYEDFYTAHSLFKFPVVEEEDKEVNEPPVCELHKNPQRKELLQACSLIVWDESLTNHREIFESAFNLLNGFNNKVVILIGDARQLPPVIKNGDKIDVISASMKSSHLWEIFQIFKLTTNMRLRGLANIENQDINEDHPLFRQRNYSQMILDIGEGKEDSNLANCLQGEDEEGDSYIGLPLLKYFLDDEEGIQNAVEFISADNIPLILKYKYTILATTNEKVDEWNTLIQSRNTQPMFDLISADHLCEVDDPKSILKDMLTEDVLKHFNKSGVPSHQLSLKVGDICIILRNLSKKDNITNNTRVRILHITNHAVRVQTICSSPKVVILPRIKFKFRLPFGESYEMIRTQFPLRLAYCMTINKSQGQEFERVLLDLRNSAFTHGHLYVALSRVYDEANIRILVSSSRLIYNESETVGQKQHAWTKNVIYRELLHNI